MPSVKLLAKTTPSNPAISTEDFSAYVARVSNPENQSNNETAPRLLRYLIKNNHWSPFEHTYLTFEINTTRDISRQILRHKSLTFQEYSQRYSVASLDMEERECRLQDQKNRQNSLDTTDEELIDNWKFVQEQAWESTTGYYQWALDMGIAKEQARALLPEGLTKTTLVATGNLRSWIHYIEIRASKETQKEHRQVAEQIKDIISKEFPVIKEALEW